MAHKSKVLVVDDNEALCNMIKDILEMEEYAVSTALDGFKALELAAQERFDVVLMDIKMPVMNGVETFKKFKAVAPDTPVIMVTAYAVEEMIRDALREGAFAAMYKPLDFDQLLKTIDTAITGGGMILVVDDEEELCETFQELLGRKGYSVSIAHDGETAIEMVRTNSFDVIMLDMKLPTLNGLETYLAIREVRPHVTVILITGYPSEMGEMAKMAVEKNAYICLEKPLDMETFLPLLREIMDEAGGREPRKPQV